MNRGELLGFGGVHTCRFFSNEFVFPLMEIPQINAVI